MKNAPALPWSTGIHGEHQVVTVQVQVCQDSGQETHWSTHDLQSDADRDIALTWHTGGMRQVRDGLLIEGVRRAALLRLLAQISTEPGYLERVGGLGQEGMQTELESLCKMVQADILKTMARVLEPAVREAVAGVLDTNTQG